MQIGYDNPGQTSWPVWIANDIGAFEKYGIQSEIIYTSSGRTIQGALNHQTPISSMDGGGMLSPNAAGGDLVAIMSTGDKPTDMIIAGRDYTDWPQLKGKIAGVNALTDETNALMTYALTENGLTPGKDITVLSLGDESVRGPALAADRVQVTIMDGSLMQQMTKDGFHPLYDFLTEGNLAWAKNMIVTTRTYAAQNPKVVSCYLMAMLEAVKYYKSNKEGSVNIASKYMEGTDKAYLELSWDTYAPTFPSVPMVKAEDWAMQQTLNPDPKVKSLDLNTLVDNSFMDALQQDGFVNSLK